MKWMRDGWDRGDGGEAAHPSRVSEHPNTQLVRRDG